LGRGQGSYFTGDGCRQDKDAYFWIVGRIDDVLNVAGHRIGTAEVESALVSNQNVPRPPSWAADELKGKRWSLSSRCEAVSKPVPKCAKSSANMWQRDRPRGEAR
jgi:non-ribosomal peptide synthetase component E (peptide arylation enzyme)